MKTCVKCVLLIICLSSAFSGEAQKVVSGVVVDSLSLNNLGGVSIKVKNTNRGTVSDTNGIFMIPLNPTDTLIFSFLGYFTSIVPANFEDEIMFVRMHDESIVLKEFVVRDRTYLQAKYIFSPTLSTTKPLQAGRGGVNFSYFSKAEKEKRKLVEVVKEFDQVKLYVAIVNDPTIRDEIMEKYSINEAQYYDILALFNQKNRDLMRSTDADLIIDTLYYFFDHSVESK